MMIFISLFEMYVLLENGLWSLKYDMSEMN